MARKVALPTVVPSVARHDPFRCRLLDCCLCAPVTGLRREVVHPARDFFRAPWFLYKLDVSRVEPLRGSGAVTAPLSISGFRLLFAQPCRAESFRPASHSPASMYSPPGSVQHG